MDSTIQKLLDEARKLTPAQRVELAEEIWATVQEETTEFDVYEPALLDELQRRAEEIDSGKVTLLSRDEFRERTRKARQDGGE